MRNKRKIIASVLVSSIFLFANYTVLKTAGSHPGSTGAPGDLTCSQNGCHKDAQVIQNSVGVNTMLFSSPDSTYIPGHTYTLTLKVHSFSTSKFGFELTSLRDADNTFSGALGILEPLRTQLISHAVGNDTRISVTHEAAGTASLSNSFTQWQMKWTAPPTNVGPVTLYYATNCTNNNGFETGDTIYVSSFKIKSPPTFTTALHSQLINESNVNIFFNKELQQIIINYELNRAAQVKTMVYDGIGDMISQNQTKAKTGAQHEAIALKPNHPKGTYIVRLMIDNAIVNKKIIVD